MLRHSDTSIRTKKLCPPPFVPRTVLQAVHGGFAGFAYPKYKTAVFRPTAVSISQCFINYKLFFIQAVNFTAF